jgi:hypothetical protein
MTGASSVDEALRAAALRLAERAVELAHAVLDSDPQRKPPQSEGSNVVRINQASA